MSNTFLVNFGTNHGELELLRSRLRDCALIFYSITSVLALTDLDTFAIALHFGNASRVFKDVLSKVLLTTQLRPETVGDGGRGQCFPTNCCNHSAQ